MTPKQGTEVEALVEQYADVLTSVPGRTDLIQHDIKLLTSEPIQSKGYPVPFKARDVMDSEIKEMLELGVIEKSVSPYSSPVVLVPKKDGSVWFCQGTNFSPKWKGYWQVGLPEHCKHLTAFETPKGLFQFKTMPFGLVNSGAAFCRLVGQVLANVSNVDSFVDDMWIFTETWEAHMMSSFR